MSAALLDHLWQSTLFGAAAWSVALALRSNSAAIRHWVWTLASVKFLVPFSALYVLGAAAGLPTPVESQPDFFGTAIAAATPVMAPTVALDESQRGLSESLVPVLLIAWGAVTAGLALRWLRGWRAAHSLSRAARPAPGALPDVRVTDVDIEPSVARVFDPVVLLPAALLGRLSAAQLDAVMAHEREHIARHDNLKAHIHRLVEVLFWFHPLVWFIGRQLREERELACDEAVLEHSHDPAEYAAGILEVCRHCAAVHSKHAVAALSGDLTQRIRQILAGASPASLGFVKSFALTVGLLLVAAGPLLAGAVDDAVRRHAQVEANSRALRDAEIGVNPVDHSAGDSGPAGIRVTGNEIVVRNTSLRELIALAYGVDGREISGGGGLLDDGRYEIRARVPGGVSDPERFEPAALRGAVTKLLAVRFNLELHVNRLCQTPCGPRALHE